MKSAPVVCTQSRTSVTVQAGTSSWKCSLLPVASPNAIERWAYIGANCAMMLQVSL